jgi:hypothetical protein
VTLSNVYLCLKCIQTKDTGPPPTLELRQTSTGILSNRPPLLGTTVSSGTTTPTPCPDLASSSTPRLSLLALSKRETARRALYSRFFRGPILGPDDVQSDTTPSNDDDDDVHKSGKKKPKIETEDLDKEERRRRKKLCREAERAARKLNRRKEKDMMKRDGAEKTRPVEEITVSSASQQEGLGPSASPTSDDERLQRKRKKTKNKRITAVSIENELDSSAAIGIDDQHFRRRNDRGDLGSLERNGSSKPSRKRHNRDRSP